jgi:hypothetical protein
VERYCDSDSALKQLRDCQGGGGGGGGGVGGGEEDREEVIFVK